MNYSLQERLKRVLKKMPLYKRERQLVLAVFSDEILLKSLMQAVKNVPYYAKYRKGACSLQEFPILRKSDIMGHAREFISRKCCRYLLHKAQTAGSTGRSLPLYYSLSTLIKKDVVADYAFSLIGQNLRVAVLRGNKPKDSAIVEMISRRRILLSSYFLSEENLKEYLDALVHYKIECIHAYPSSLSILARLIKKYCGTFCSPTLKGILTSSETFSKEDRLLVQEVFPGVKMVDYYGQNELVCCAISEDNGCYKFFNSYGYVEFLETGQYVNGNRIAEIVATSIMNKDMPFIRYGTDDYVELDSLGNVVSIIGRKSDFLVDKNQNIVPCMYLLHYDSKKNMVAYQFYQDTVGELVYRVVGNDDFSQVDANLILHDLQASFKNMECRVDIVDKIERTARGKQLRLIQKLDLSLYS